MHKINRRTYVLHNDEGFTIIEVLIAVSIFSIAFLALTAVILDASKTARATNIADQSIMVGQESIEMLSSLPIDDDDLDGTIYEIEIDQPPLTLEYEAYNPVDSDGDGTSDFITISVRVFSNDNLKMQTYYRRQIN